MKRALLFTAFLPLFFLQSGCIHAPTDLSAFLPVQDGLQPRGPLLKADNDSDLFRHIDGGADFYIGHGFRRAVFQTYESPGRKKFTLVIYEMGDAGGARAVFRVQAGDDAAGAGVGDESALEDYYLLFRRGRYYISVTGFDPEQETRDQLLAAAKQVDRKMIASQ